MFSLVFLIIFHIFPWKASSSSSQTLSVCVASTSYSQPQYVGEKRKNMKAYIGVFIRRLLITIIIIISFFYIPSKY